MPFKKKEKRKQGRRKEYHDLVPISIRVPQILKSSLDRIAKEHKITVTELSRNILIAGTLAFQGILDIRTKELMKIVEKYKDDADRTERVCREAQELYEKFDGFIEKKGKELKGKLRE